MGNEGDSFLKLLNPYQMSTTTSTCCSATCPNPVQTVQSTSLILPLPTSDISGEGAFFDSLECWHYPDDSQCGRKFASKPSEGVSFYEDLTLNEHGDAHTSWHCASVRVCVPCTMLNLKSFVLFSVDLPSRGGQGGGGSKTGPNNCLDFLFWAKFFSFWCNTLEWWSLYLHFPVQQWLVYV